MFSIYFNLISLNMELRIYNSVVMCLFIHLVGFNIVNKHVTKSTYKVGYYNSL